MKNLSYNQAIKYVTGGRETVDATIVIPHPPNHATIKWGDKHRAIARYSSGGEPNTFHFAEDESEAATAAAAKPSTKPFKPGVKNATPETKPTNGAEAPATK